MYHVTSNINGCESIDSVSVDLIPLPIIIAPSDIAICDGEDTLLYVVSDPLSSVISWDNGVTNNLSFTPTTIGTTIYTVTSLFTLGTKTCESTDETEITVNIIPSINAGLNDTICDDENFILTGINPDGAMLIWNNGITDNAIFTPTSTLEYIVFATLNNCENSDTMILEVNPNPELLITSPFTICAGEDAVLNATSSNADNIIWDNGVTNSQVFTPVNTLLYVATASIIEGTNICTTSESVTISVNPNPIINADESGDTIITLCRGDSYTLIAENINNSTLIWTNGVIDNVLFTPTDSLMYVVTANLNGCFSSDSIIIDVVSKPIADAGLDQKICVGDSVLIDGTTLNQSLANISWQHGLIDSMYIYPLITEVHTVTATLGNCSTMDDVTITVVNLPDADFSFNPNPVTIENTELVFTQLNVYEGEVYEWEFGDNTSSVLEAPIHIFPEVPGLTYDVELMVTDSIGCIGSNSVQFTVFDVIIYYIPNAFTPDGDTYNETFQPVFTSGFDPYDYHLILFNRWGETIFESFNAEIGWDGTYKGKNVPDGVYTWTVQFGELLSDRKIIDRGTVTLVR
jgi:gliding motility-associated-like protein